MEKLRLSPSGSLAPGVKLYWLPSVTAFAGLPLIVGAELVTTACTVMAKADSDDESWPSLTLITMFSWVPASSLAGVPERRPVAVSKDAQEGGFAISKTSASPSASLALGVNS